MLSEEQFVKLLESLTANAKFQEMLIRIDENTKTIRENQSKHETEDAGKFSVLQKAVETAHQRIDGFRDFRIQITTVVTVVSVIFGLMISVFQIYNSSLASSVQKMVRNESSVHNP